jgi:hypothetical protein
MFPFMLRTTSPQHRAVDRRRAPRDCLLLALEYFSAVKETEVINSLKFKAKPQDLRPADLPGRDLGG